MSQTITSPTVRFDKGQLQVIPLPEEPKYPCLDCRTMDCEATQDYCEHTKYREAVAYARAHPIPIIEEDEHKIEDLLWKRYVGEGMWGLKDLTDYKLEGVKLRIESDCQRQKDEGFDKCTECYFKGSGLKQCKQVACLIEDDKQ